jgi:uncharacterized protein YqjF (DUF2071 family)
MTSGQEPTPPATFGLVQTWEKLLFMHWKVPVARVRPLVPERLTVDTYDGHAYVTLTPFALTGFRETYVPPIPFLSSFYELNARTYVHLDGSEHGIWFFSLDCSQLLAVIGARLFYSLPYFSADITMQDCEGWVQYESHRSGEPEGRAYFRATYQPGEPLPYEKGSEHFFLTERYVLYSSPKGEGTLLRARVHHEPGELHRASVRDFASDLFECAGVGPVEGEPILHYWEAKKVQADLPESCG